MLEEIKNKMQSMKSCVTIGYRVIKNPVFKSELKTAYNAINSANKERRMALKDLKKAYKSECNSIEKLHTEKVQKAVIRLISLTGGVIKQEQLTMQLEGDKSGLETVFD